MSDMVHITFALIELSKFGATVALESARFGDPCGLGIFHGVSVDVGNFLIGDID